MVEAVEQRVRSSIEEIGEERVVELANHLPAGKMLRSKLILAIAPEAVDLAAIVEMIHLASLLHDDVIDGAELRRGAPSINSLYGNRSAIMLGDILYSKAFSQLVHLPLPIPEIISNAVTLLSVGELLDVELSREFNPDKELYLDMVYKKTASLIEASARSAAWLAGKDPESYGIYGRNLGIAFQIVDDLLDITGDSSTLGKPAMSDFREGKSTLPYIYLYHWLAEPERERLKSMHGRPLNREEEEWLRGQLLVSGGIEQAKAEARRLAREGLEALGDEGGRLAEIMDSLIERTY
ncbi:MAG: polyprenyl synthetase family protein [Epsilonproteobacteria bacterium]|nr:octaprenyl-diphosphate synthase [Campylobacterota bacterium]NPA56543.1 polyprenyl synthetase family protein [Campylobacterota bacterium]